MIRQGDNKVTEVILHTSATPSSWYRNKSLDTMISEIDSWHRARGWRMIGYHRVISPNGSIGIGRSLYEQGAHVAGHNEGTIGICLIPVNDHNGIRVFSSYFTQEQDIALRNYLNKLEKLHGEPLKITGHNEYSNKECPGFRVKEWL